MNGEKVLLLQVFIVDRADLSETFVAYDTEIERTGEYYSLPKGKLLVLFLIPCYGSGAFTTIRRWTPAKEKYYKSLMGKEFVLEITE